MRYFVSTAPSPGAIAIIQVVGGKSVEHVELLGRLAGRVDTWSIGRAVLINLADIDEGLAVRVSDLVTQIMPHGGPRVIQRLSAWLAAHGVRCAEASDVNRSLRFPEASDDQQAAILGHVAKAESPLAIDLLLDQPRRWSQLIEAGETITHADLERSARLDRLITPPLVAMAGSPNVGKSTLSNALIGRTMSIALDEPGTTRDYTVARVDLGGLVVDWHDTPGLRETKDPIERRAIDLGRRLLERADLLIAMRDARSDWPRLPRSPDLWVLSKADERKNASTRESKPSGQSAANPLRVSALNGLGLTVLVEQIRNRLVGPEDLASQRPWVVCASREPAKRTR